MIYAVVPAGGRSTRMGRPKLALPLGGQTVLEHVVTALRGGGAERVVVVVGPHVPELVPLAETAGAEVCRLREPTPDMRATVQHGLDWLEDRYHPRSDDAWLLAPGDHPTINGGVVRQLCESYADRPGRSIIVPVHDGRRGHPTLIAWRHVAGIRAYPAGHGLNTYFRQFAPITLEMPLDDAGVLTDLDTPEDYERIRQSWLA